ncbi:Ion transport protein-domain-containing protein [Hysterangium stoloniferum]|nr:Ion transport protein-domain-containing protein [Hysterangium stoloniferum]
MRRRTTLQRVSRNLQRISVRVVGLGSAGVDDRHIRLADASDETISPPSDPTPPAPLAPGPLRGTTIGFLGPRNPVRLAMYDILMYPYTEPLILFLILFNAIILIIQSARAIFIDTTQQSRGYFQSWEDHVLFILFIFYTIEAFARICLNGVILDPETPCSAISIGGAARYIWQSVFRPKPGPRFHGIVKEIVKPFALVKESPQIVTGNSPKVDEKPAFGHGQQPSLTYSHRPIPFVTAIQTQRSLIKRGVPYLRHSWSRIDFIAIVGFWIAFTLSVTGADRAVSVDPGTGTAILVRHIGIFRALSVLRCARLLAVTNGTTTIMQSLKMARPLLAQVAYFVIFAMILFSVIGVQSFRGSFRRQCVLNSVGGAPAIPLGQQCGGHIDPVTLNVDGYIPNNNNSSGDFGKGFVCPLGQVCQEQSSNPSDNLESYDNVFLATLQVIVIASANAWSSNMYSMIDAEFFVSCIFFIVCIVVLNFWLINLFVAVITNTFQAIRSQTRKSAFGATQSDKAIVDERDGWAMVEASHSSKSSWMRESYQITRLVWPVLAVLSLGLAASKTASTPIESINTLGIVELGISIAFDLEIIWRFCAHLPDWRAFGHEPANWIDLVLAIACSIIQIPVVHSSQAYAWLTAFQLARWYRVILEVPRMRPLILTVFGNSSGLINMTIFLLLTNGLAALAAVQLLRGDLDDSSNMNFSQIWIAFLAMYQILSSENWTDVLYKAAAAEQPTVMTWIIVIFLSFWFLFGNFILIQLFIAVINENFDVAEEKKREQQVAEHLANTQSTAGRFAWISKLNPYKYTKSNPKAIVVENLPSNLILPMQKAVVQNGSLRRGGRLSEACDLHSTWSGKSIRLLHRLFSGETRSDEVPMTTLSAFGRRESVAHPFNDGDNDVAHHFDVLAAFNADTIAAEDTNNIRQEQRAQKADFIAAHPSYDKTFWLFSQNNTLRRMCQALVEPPNGERIFGRPASHTCHALFQFVLFLAVVGGIVVAAIATPLYRRNYYAEHGHVRVAWFVLAENSFVLVLLVEFIIKVIADGFIFTPNAYLLSIWNVADMIILIGLVVNAVTSLVFIGGLTRLTRSLKALRALRFITLFDKMRSTFHSLLIVGFVRILDAGILAVLYMIPYAVWGLNIFSGLSYGCNDSGVSGKSGCQNEYTANTASLGNDYGFLAPRVWANPTTSTRWSFDNFGDSILILFEIVSLEGWIDVMSAAIDITGRDLQPKTNAAQWNAIFFLIYNLLGAVVILTLFVSIIIGNFSSRSGLALLTKPQREWIDLLKLIKRQRPSKRPKVRPTKGLRAWCFDRATSKHGYWMTSMTVLYILHIILLMQVHINHIEFAPHCFSRLFKDQLFLGFSSIYVVDITVRFVGLGWSSFRANGWNIFDILVVTGSIATTIPILAGSTGFAIQQLQKLFLVSIAFKLVQRNDSLNQLFKTSISSLPVILSLLVLWFTLFLFFGILYVEVFGLTRWESAETHNQNYTSLGRALVMLAFMSTGEGWNQYMHDFTVTYPRCTTSSAKDADSDCGSPGWAYFLFIAWNILSMYIFVNMFTGVVVENFSYVFQLAGGAKSVDREQMRAFKKVWAEFANQRTGYLERSKFVPFFGKLTGVFEVRIYPTGYQIKSLVANAKTTEESNPQDSSLFAPELDLRKLQLILMTLDTQSIRQRRMLYNRLYHETRLSFERGKGISFTNMLLMLAHNKLITDKEALSVKDILARQEITRMVSDAVNMDRVESLLRMIYHRRRFLRFVEEKRLFTQNIGIPAIVVDDDTMSLTPLMTGRGIAQLNSPPLMSEYMSRLSEPLIRPVSCEPESPRNPDRDERWQSRRLSDLSMLSSDLAHHHL